MKLSKYHLESGRDVSLDDWDTHDYLWRVHDLVDPKTWRRRYDHINDFERMLVEEGLVIE